MYISPRQPPEFVFITINRIHVHYTNRTFLLTV